MNLQELTNIYDFKNQTIVITGGAGVLCAEIASALIGCNANVAVLDRDTALAGPLLERIGPSAAGRILVVYADVLHRESLEAAYQKVQETFGNIDALINGAGGNKPDATTGVDRPFFELADSPLRDVFNLNIMGTIIPSQVFGRYMAKRGEGVIVNISSMAAFRPLTRVIGYSAAKAGVSNFTQWLAVHMAQEHSPRIRVNAIAPGFFLTAQNRYLLTEKETGELTARGRSIIDHTPMKRFGEPADLLGAVLWLLSPASAFVTGTVIPIDGGFSAFSGV
jgi:NAD(P)-dependent dehydrogenase (short-subunit alcohol dehydrogenase family)